MSVSINCLSIPSNTFQHSKQEQLHLLTSLYLPTQKNISNNTGKYVTFLDSDDYLERDAIEILYRSLVGNNVDMCKGGFKKTSNKGEILFVRQYKNEVFEGERARLEFLPRMVGSRPDTCIKPITTILGR